MHLFVDEVQAVVKPPINSLILATADAINRQGLRTVGLLASPTTFESGLFQKHLPGMMAVTPGVKQQKRLEKVIRNVIGGQTSNQDKRFLAQQIKLLKDLGAQKVILGCTELSVLANDMALTDVIDPLQLVVERIFNN